MFIHLRGMKKIIIAAGVLLMLGSVAGCGASSAEYTEGAAEKETAPGHLEIEIPVQLPNIIVDQVGYSTESDKAFTLRGKKLPDTFQIRRVDTDEVVYSGDVLKSSFDQDQQLYTGIGRFNDLKIPGEYYISADYLGQSYTFTISEDTYTEVFDSACQKFYINRCGIAISRSDETGHSACHTTKAHMQDDKSVTIDVYGGWHMDDKADRDTLVGSRIVEILLLAYEINEESFGDDTGIPESNNQIPDILDEVKYEVDWLLRMQDPKTGGVYLAAVTDTTGSSDVFAAPVEVTAVSMDATINFAAALARFSTCYQQYDEKYATEILRAADRAFESFLKNQNTSENTSSFKAAAALYRATGNEKYESVLNEYFSRDNFESLFYSDENVFSGAVAYLSTKQIVDKTTCSELIRYLMQKSEAIAARSSESSFLVADNVEDGDFTAFLDDLRCLSITNHIIYNHEYTTIIENHVHYMMGMNPDCINYITTDTDRTYLDDVSKNKVMNNPLNVSMVVLALAGL